jgi:hypothetical protein
MKTFDLNDHKILFTNDVQKNIEMMLDQLGEHFIVKDNKISFPTCIETIESILGKKLYVVRCNINERETFLYPFLINMFMERTEVTAENDCYIANIHKYENWSGTEIMNFVIHLLKLLNVNNVYIDDGTRVSCMKHDNDLSYFKLIEKRETYYERFGFKPIPHGWYYIYFKDNDDVKKHVNEIVDRINKVTCKEIRKQFKKLYEILKLIKKKGKYDDIKYYRLDFQSISFDVEQSNYVFKKSEMENETIKLIDNCEKIIMMLKVKDKLFVDLLKRLFYDDCENYFFIEQMLLHCQEGRFVGLEYNGEKIFLNYLNDFYLLRIIRGMRLKLNLETQTGGYENKCYDGCA